MLVYGAVITANMLLFYAAISRIPLGVAVAIAFGGPLLVAVLGSRKLMDFVWVIVAAVGIIMLSPLTNVALDSFGVLLALMTAGAWALYIIVTKQIGGLVEGHSMLALSMGVAALVALPFGGAGAAKVLTDPALIVMAVFVALMSSAIPFSLEFTALKRLTPRVFGLLCKRRAGGSGGDRVYRAARGIRCTGSGGDWAGHDRGDCDNAGALGQLIQYSPISPTLPSATLRKLSRR
jgi:inner membrane transporter RhtA